MTQYTYSFRKCGVCGREILVESYLIGVPHTASMNVTCAKCVHKSEILPDFRKENPKAAADIEKWAKEASTK